MNLRDQLTSAALLGACPERLNLPATDTALDTLVAQLAGRDPAARALDLIALVTSHDAAGILPLTAPALPDPAPADPRPECPRDAAAHLLAILADPGKQLDEWLGLVAKSHFRPPSESVPDLLDRATTGRELRALVLEACGPLAPWLAQFRPEWSWALIAGAGESLWETGTLAERVTVVRGLRQSDPAKARALVSNVWPSENADTRRLFIEALETGLSLDDEELLEKALDEKSVVVRRSASALLGSLAGSKLAVRMRDRLASRIEIRLEGLIVKRTVVQVEPFDKLDAAMARDGIEAKPPQGSGFGERAWWTLQALAAVAPRHWSDPHRGGITKLIEGTRVGQWAALLLEGWRRAAIRYRDQDWLSALALEEAVAGESASQLFRAMAPETREETYLTLLDKNGGGWILGAPSLCPHPWSRTFTVKFLKQAQRHFPKDPAADARMYREAETVLRQVARLADPFDGFTPPSPLFEDFAITLHFRRAMRAALPGGNPRA